MQGRPTPADLQEPALNQTGGQHVLYETSCGVTLPSC